MIPHPIIVRDKNGEVVARITQRPNVPPKPRTRGRLAIVQLLILLGVWKLFAWLVVLALAALK